MSLSIKIPKLLTKDSLEFPNPNDALQEPNGLLAIGGDLSPERLLAAYRQGIFPWYNEDDPILWWCPDPRAVLFLNDFKISHSFAKRLRKQDYLVTFDQRFAQVMQACASPRSKQTGTWINQEMIESYCRLHELGYAHSVEIWMKSELVGGIYGIALEKIFCGESMFSRQSNASKIALYHLINQLKERDFLLIDCQIQNPHLKSLGAIEIPRQDFLRLIFSADK